MKTGLTSLIRETSNKTDTDKKATEQETFNRKYEMKLAHFNNIEDEFEEN